MATENPATIPDRFLGQFLQYPPSCDRARAVSNPSGDAFETSGQVATGYLPTSVLTLHPNGNHN